MKWIGQYIQDFIARFRNDVYLEDVDTGTIASGGNLGLDSNNKIVKNTVSGGMTGFTVEDGDTTDVTISDGKHWKFVEGGGIDINWTDTSDGSSSDEYDLTFTMNKTLQDLLIDSGHIIRGVAGSEVVVQSCQDINLHFDYDQSSTAGNHSFKLTNGDGDTIFSVDESGNILTRGTITAQTTGGATKYPSKGSAGNILVDDAGAVSTRTVSDLKSDLSLAKADVGLGSVENKSSATIRGEIVASDVPDLNTDKLTAGTLPVARGGTGAGSAADAFTALKQAASDSVTGVVELATTAEADTGTDTARAVTPAGLKSHVDARSAYQYISFVGNITANTSGNGYWEYPSPNGISNHTWTQIVKNTTGGVNNRDTTTVGDEVGIDRLNQGSAGIRIPYAGTIVGFTGSGRNASGDRVYYAGLFVGTPDWGTTNDINAELVAVATADNNSGSYLSRPSKLEDLSRSYSIAAGDVIYPAIKGSGTNADIIQANMTIVIKTSLV